MESVKTQYGGKLKDYFSNVRMDIISILPNDPQQSILEIGAGEGNTLAYIKKHNLASKVMGVELMRIADSYQEDPLIDSFQIGNVENEEINAAPGSFDVIICADVLEHLVDPWGFVQKLSGYLKKNGKLIVSIPNIREIKVLAKLLLKGDFRYNEQGGIMDKTHLRFFCKKNIREMLTTDTLEPEFSIPNFMLPVLAQGRQRRIINRLTLKLFEDFLTTQYLFIARKR